MEPLNPYQQRYLLSILSQVGQHLDSAERLLQDPAEPAVMAEGLRHLRDELNVLRDDLAIQPADEAPSPRWQALTNLEFASVELQELSYSKLRGYGELDAQAYQQLKSRIDRLQEGLARQLQALRDSR